MVFQALHEPGAAAERGVPQLVQCAAFSGRYRAVMAACARQLHHTRATRDEAWPPRVSTAHCDQAALLGTLQSVWHLVEIFFFRAPVLVKGTGLLRGIEVELQQWVAEHGADLTPLPSDWTKVRVRARCGAHACSTRACWPAASSSRCLPCSPSPRSARPTVDRCVLVRKADSKTELRALCDVIAAMPRPLAFASSVEFYTQWHQWQQSIDALLADVARAPQAR